MKHEELIDFTQKILETNYLPVYKFTLPCENLEHLDQGLRYHILGVKNTSQFFQDLLEKLKPGKVYFNTDLFQCTFVFLLLPDEKTVFYCGPVVFEKMQGERFEELFSSLPLKETYHDAIQTYYQRLPFLGSYALFESLFLELGKKLYGDSCEVVYSNTDFFDHWNNAYKHCLRDQEHPFSNIDVIEKRYESENMLINAVASGRESQTLELISKFETWLLPQRTTNNLRDMKNYTITLNTLLRKAAEQAGVHPIHIDAYSNCNVVMLESLTSPSAVSACTTDNRTWILPDYQGTSASDPLSTDSKGRCLPGDRSVCGSDTEQSGKPSRGQCKLSVYFIFKRNGNVPDRLCQSLSN